jgi:hypothetical protein
MRKLIKILIPMLLSCAGAQAQDEFAKVRCEADIAKALTGQRESNEPVVATEARHKDLGLKDLGADIISDHVNTISSKAAWRIDEKAAKFVKMDTSDLLCPRSGIYAADGGT